jgi:CrcB protein
MMVKNLFLVFIGSGIGGVLRYTSAFVAKIFKFSFFPLQTLVVNILASLILGIFVVLISKNKSFETLWYSFLVVGICGGFSTFSTFSYENVMLFQNGQYFYLFLNVVLSVFLSFLAVFLGFQLAN